MRRPRQSSGLGRAIKNYLEHGSFEAENSLATDASGVWQFTEIGEVISGLMTILETGIPSTGAVHNFASPAMVTAQELRECVDKIMGNTAETSEISRPDKIDGKYKADPLTTQRAKNSLERLIFAIIQSVQQTSQVWEEFKIAS